jgi:hypothetical protein
MKVLQNLHGFGVVAALMTLAACGSSQSTTPTFSSYGSTATGGISGTTQASATSPIYSGSQVIGYKSRIALFSGNQENVATNAFVEQAAVQAGDRLVINPQVATFTVQQAFCNGVLVASSSNSVSQQMPYLSFTYNGQIAGNGMVVPAAGVVTIQSTLNVFGVSCAWGGLQNVEYVVSLSDYYSSVSVVAVDRCVNTNGAAITCPY